MNLSYIYSKDNKTYKKATLKQMQKHSLYKYFPVKTISLKIRVSTLRAYLDKASL